MAPVSYLQLVSTRLPTPSSSTHEKAPSSAASWTAHAWLAWKKLRHAASGSSHFHLCSAGPLESPPSSPLKHVASIRNHRCSSSAKKAWIAAPSPVDHPYLAPQLLGEFSHNRVLKRFAGLAVAARKPTIGLPPLSDSSYDRDPSPFILDHYVRSWTAIHLGPARSFAKLGSLHCRPAPLVPYSRGNCR